MLSNVDEVSASPATAAAVVVVGVIPGEGEEEEEARAALLPSTHDVRYTTPERQRGAASGSRTPATLCHREGTRRLSIPTAASRSVAPERAASHGLPPPLLAHHTTVTTAAHHAAPFSHIQNSGNHHHNSVMAGVQQQHHQQQPQPSFPVGCTSSSAHLFAAIAGGDSADPLLPGLRATTLLPPHALGDEDDEDEGGSLHGCQHRNAHGNGGNSNSGEGDLMLLRSPCVVNPHTATSAARGSRGGGGGGGVPSSPSPSAPAAARAAVGSPALQPQLQPGVLIARLCSTVGGSVRDEDEEIIARPTVSPPRVRRGRLSSVVPLSSAATTAAMTPPARYSLDIGVDDSNSLPCVARYYRNLPNAHTTDNTTTTTTGAAPGRWGEEEEDSDPLPLQLRYGAGSMLRRSGGGSGCGGGNVRNEEESSSPFGARFSGGYGGDDDDDDFLPSHLDMELQAAPRKHYPKRASSGIAGASASAVAAPDAAAAAAAAPGDGDPASQQKRASSGLLSSSTGARRAGTQHSRGDCRLRSLETSVPSFNLAGTHSSIGCLSPMSPSLLLLSSTAVFERAMAQPQQPQLQQPNSYAAAAAAAANPHVSAVPHDFAASLPCDRGGGEESRSALLEGGVGSGGGGGYSRGAELPLSHITACETTQESLRGPPFMSAADLDVAAQLSRLTVQGSPTQKRLAFDDAMEGSSQRRRRPLEQEEEEEEEGEGGSNAAANPLQDAFSNAEEEGEGKGGRSAQWRRRGSASWTPSPSSRCSSVASSSSSPHGPHTTPHVRRRVRPGDGVGRKRPRPGAAAAGERPTGLQLLQSRKRCLDEMERGGADDVGAPSLDFMMADGASASLGNPPPLAVASPTLGGADAAAAAALVKRARMEQQRQQQQRCDGYTASPPPPLMLPQDAVAGPCSSGGAAPAVQTTATAVGGLSALREIATNTATGAGAAVAAAAIACGPHVAQPTLGGYSRAATQLPHRP